MASVEASVLDWARVRRLPIFSDCGDEEFSGVMARSAVLHRGAGEVLIADQLQYVPGALEHLVGIHL